MLDDLRSYLQMASGLTEATTGKARDAVTGLLAQGLSLSARAVPSADVMGQVTELADELVTTSRNNREMLVGMIRAEVDRNVGRMGFVREDELAALRRHVQRLEKQVSDLESTLAAPPPPPAPVSDAPVSDAPVSDAPVSPSPAADHPPKKKKKKIVVDGTAGADA